MPTAYDGYKVDIDLYAGCSVVATEQTCNRRAFLYNILHTVPQARWDLGYILIYKYIRIFLYNPCDTAQSIQVHTSGDEGINIIDGETGLSLIAPFSLPAGYTQEIIFEVTLEGPTQIDAVFDFFVAGEQPVQFRITGIRAPVIIGTTATLLSPHNWITPLKEKLSWKTDVLVASDRTEQRMSLRVLPRREYDIELLEFNDYRETVETQLAARKVEYFLIPTWHDINTLTQPVSTGTTIINVDFDPGELDFFQEGYVVLFKDKDTYDVRRVFGWTINSITVTFPIDNDYGVGDYIAPCRYYKIMKPVKEDKPTDSASVFRFTAHSINENFRRQYYLFESYNNAYIFPLMDNINYKDVGVDITHKWTILDNNTNIVPLVVKDAEEPLYKRKVKVQCWTRELTNKMLQFLFTIKGRWKPFWVANPSTSLELTSTTIQGDIVLYVKNINYFISLDGCHSRSHIRIIYKDGTIEHRRVSDSFVNPLAPAVEELTIDSPLPVDTGPHNVAAIQWLEYVRMDSDEIVLNWIADGKFETEFDIVTLPYMET